MLHYQLLGFVFLLLAVGGVLLPLVPATPFLLLAAACFARSSPRWHSWLLGNRTFGPMIRDWEDKRCISCRIKAVAIGSMLLLGSFSVLVAVKPLPLKLLGVLLIAAGTLVVLRLPTCSNNSDQAN